MSQAQGSREPSAAIRDGVGEQEVGNLGIRQVLTGAGRKSATGGVPVKNPHGKRRLAWMRGEETVNFNGF